MLLRLALECLLEGVWIKNNQAWLDKNNDFSLTNDGKYVGIPGAGDHELKQLADAARVTVSKEESALLDRLTAFVKYAGRYPIATTHQQMFSKKTPEGALRSPKF